MRIIEQNNIRISIIDEDKQIDEPQDAIDVMADAMFLFDSVCLVCFSRQLHDDFFDLKTGFAGEVLQKFSNYKVRLAIVGDFSRYPGQALKDFIYECNQGQQLFWVDSIEAAIESLAPTKQP